MPAPTEQTNYAVVQDPLNGRWMRFRDPVEILEANSIDQVMPLMERIDIETSERGMFAVGMVSYEAAPGFDDVLPTKENASVPLIWFGLYRDFEVLGFPDNDIQSHWEGEPDLDWTLLQTESEYRTALDRIHDYIREGDAYQVNYSFRLRSESTQGHWPLFVKMVRAQNLDQQPGYCVYLDTEHWTLCSASPELFFEYRDRLLVSRPMKGTAPRGLGYQDDREKGLSLSKSLKNRAENIMIADMVRNDMGKIADTGTVRTRDVLHLEKYPTFWTMTTTVECETDPWASKIFQALFPAASITGAPKRRAMEIIDELESLPRNTYTGAAGFITPNRSAQFNVAIRSVLIKRISQVAEFGVGGGIVWDSDSGDELSECHTKARVLTYAQPSFDLIETLKWSPGSGYRYLDRHVERLLESASYFSWIIDPEEVSGALSMAEGGFGDHEQRVRLLVSKSGKATITSTDLTPLPDPYQVRLASSPVSSKNYFLYHKTSYRSAYENAKSQARCCDDVILWNERDEATESCRANLIARIGGKWVTPPVSSGLLNGLEREMLLARGVVEERVISVEELKAAEEIQLVNSVRGAWRIDLID